MSDLDDISDHKYQKGIVIATLWWIAQPLFCSILSVERGLSRYSLIPDHFKAFTVGDQIVSPDLKFGTQPTAKSFPSLSHSYLAETLEIKHRQNQHLLKFMWVLSSLYNEDVQFADCSNVHPPKKKEKRRYFHAFPLVALPPLANYFHLNQFFYQFQDVHPFPI